MLALAAALSLVAGQTADFDLQAAIRLDARARTAGLGDPPNVPVAFDVEATPLLAGSMEKGAGRILLTYSPTFRLRDPFSTERAGEVYQSEYLFMQWFRPGHPRPYLGQSFSFGVVDLSTLFYPSESPGVAFPGSTIPGGPISGPMAPTQQPLLDPIPVLGTLKQLYFDINGGVAWPLGRNVTLDTSVGFTYGGGADYVSQTLLPIELNARGRAQLEVRLSAIDVLTTRVDFIEVQFSRPPTVLAVFSELDVTERYHRQLLATTFVELGVGVGGIRGWPGDEPRPDWTADPIVDLILSHRLLNAGPHAVSFDANAHLGPFVDRFLATIYERIDATATLTYSFRQAWQLSASGGAGRSLTDVVGTDVITTYVQARASYVPPRWWRLDLSGANSTAVYGGTLINNWMVTLALTLRAEGMF